MKWLFGLRDDAVHFQGLMHKPVWHEDLHTNVAEENVIFSVESAERAVTFLMEVFATIFGPGSKRQPRVADWGAASAHVVAELDSLRSS